MKTKCEFEVERIAGQAGHEEERSYIRLIVVVEAETAAEALDLVVGPCPEGWETGTDGVEYAYYYDPDTSPRYADYCCASPAPGEK